jgi:hypothetical protein
MDTPDRNTRTGGAAAMRALLLAALLAPALPALAQRALLSHAEQPAKLIRKTTVYDAPAGASLQPGDIVESGARGLQIEWPNGALMALGPSSSVQLDAAAGAPSVSLLRGWIKVAASKPASQLSAAAGPLEVRAGGGSGILHLAADMTELFVEQGTLSATDKDKAATPPLAVNREQYALRRGALPLQLMPRAPKLFVSGMPRAFFDPLVPVANRAKAAEAAPLREVDARDLADWNDVPAIVNKRLVAQFATRLADPAFAKDAETLLANNADWRQAVQNIKKRNTITNYLF